MSAAASAVGSIDRSTPWIGGRGFDLVFFHGGSALAVLAGIAMLGLPAVVIPLWWTWLFLVDGPHLFSTWLRTYLDPDERRARGRLLATSLLFMFVPGLGAFAITKLSGSRLPFDGFLLLATIWSWLHAIRQQYGILALYQRRAGAGARNRRIDAWFLQGSLWSFYLLFLVGHPWSRKALMLPMDPGPAVSAALLVAAALLAVATLAYAVRLAILGLRGDDRAIAPGVFVLVSVVLTQAFAMFVIGGFEPLIAEPTNPEQFFLAAAVVGGLPHGVQYLGVIFFANRGRYVGPGRSPVQRLATRSSLALAQTTRSVEGPAAVAACSSLAARLGRAPWATYAVCVVASLGYLWLNGARGTSPGWVVFPLDGDAARIFLALYWGLFLHHFWLDQHIWKVQRDPALKRELGVA